MTSTKDTVQAAFKELQAVLNVREAELIHQLDLITQNKLKDLAAQRDQIETTLAQLCSCLQFMKESLGTGNEGNLLVMKANTMNRIKKLTAPLQPDFLNLSAEADVSFLDSIDTTGLYSTSVNMTMLCKNYGKIFSPSLPECFVSGLSGSALLGATSKITLLAKNSEGEPFEKPIKLLDCELVSEVSGTKLGCSIERRGGSEYEISYHPVVKGGTDCISKPRANTSKEVRSV